MGLYSKLIYLKFHQYLTHITYILMIIKLISTTFRKTITVSALFSFSYKKSERGSSTLEQYKRIKEKQKPPVRKSASKQGVKQSRCQGCNSLLQSQDVHKYGYIRKEVLEAAQLDNIKLIQASYGAKVENMDSRVLGMIRQVQSELGVPIFNQKTNKLDNLDRVEVLLRMQQKIDSLQQQQQSMSRTKSSRTQIYCYRCYSLKYQNRLPYEYDIKEQYPLNSQQALLQKVFHKHRHGGTHFLYLIDVLDIAGSFTKDILDRLIDEKAPFSLVINKLDIVNDKYLNPQLIQQHVRQTMSQFVEQRADSSIHMEAISEVRIFMVSSVSKAGLRQLEHFIQQNHINRLQLLGFPNTGKTTLLNELAKLKRPVSKVPGTTPFITEHSYKQRLIFDMPGLYSQKNLYNLINKPNLKALLTWNKKFSPPLMLHRAFFFGGKVECEGAKLILFGLGGACSSDNRWFMLNYRQFWKGMPALDELQMTRYEHNLQFREGKADDLQICGWGFISFRLSHEYYRDCVKRVNFYLPKGIGYSFRPSVVKDSQLLHFKSAVRKRHLLDRVQRAKDSSKVASIL